LLVITTKIIDQPTSQGEARLCRCTQRLIPTQTGIPVLRIRSMAQLTQANVEALIAAALAPVQQDLVNAQAEVQRLQGQLIQQAAAAQQLAAPETQFARTPASMAMIDYKSKYGLELYKIGS
jgi:hypothetical protein